MHVIDPLYRMSEYFELELMAKEAELRRNVGIFPVDASNLLITLRIETLKKARHACASVEELEAFLAASSFPEWRSKWADFNKSM